MINREALIELLRMTADELEKDASFEGRIQYSCLHDECEGHQGWFVVRAAIRTGNDMGQGGMSLVHGDILMDAPPPTVREQVLEFHQKIGQPIAERPAVPDDERIRLRASLVSEEAIELLEALFDSPEMIEDIKYKVNDLIIRGQVRVDFPSAVDALADIDYVVEGSRIEFGVDGAPIAAEVHRANMEKQGGPRREDGKVMKPPGWRPPDIEGKLREQGWEP